MDGSSFVPFECLLRLSQRMLPISRVWQGNVLLKQLFKKSLENFCRIFIASGSKTDNWVSSSCSSAYTCQRAAKLTICLTRTARFFLFSSRIFPGSTCIAFCLCRINFWSPYLVSCRQRRVGSQLTARTLMVVPKRECLVDRFFDPRALVFLSASSNDASWSIGPFSSVPFEANGVATDPSLISH